jgi:hypothetical protein
MSGQPGTSGLGGGGGGASANAPNVGGNSGSGGGGRVILSYAGTGQKGSGGTVTTYNSGGTVYQVHTFNNSSTYTG